MNFKGRIAMRVSLNSLLVCLLLCSGCATRKFHAIQTPDANVTPDQSLVMIAREGLAISVAKTRTPYGHESRIVSFEVTLINQTDEPLEFIPKDAFLFDQKNRQVPALSKEALMEASTRREKRWSGAIGWGWGYGPGYRRSMVHGSWWHSFGSPSPWDAPRRYEGMVGKAMPFTPVTIFPQARLSGHLYFEARVKELTAVQLRITRLKEMPQPNQTAPREIVYTYQFAVH
jgi:hypothetical protein